MDKSACRLLEKDITQTANTNSKLDPVGSTQCHGSLIDSLTLSQTLKDRATQLLIKYKSGALVTQFLLLQTSPSKLKSLVTFFARCIKLIFISNILMPADFVKLSSDRLFRLPREGTMNTTG